MRKPFFKFLILLNLAITATLALAIFSLPTSECINQYLTEIKDNKVTIEETTDLYEDTLSELKKYKATEEIISDLGANEEQAQAIIQASELYHIDPKH